MGFVIAQIQSQQELSDVDRPAAPKGAFALAGDRLDSRMACNRVSYHATKSGPFARNAHLTSASPDPAGNSRSLATSC
jgi:hypothetical protein